MYKEDVTDLSMSHCSTLNSKPWGPLYWRSHQLWLRSTEFRSHIQTQRYSWQEADLHTTLSDFNHNVIQNTKHHKIKPSTKENVSPNILAPLKLKLGKINTDC